MGFLSDFVQFLARGWPDLLAQTMNHAINVVAAIAIATAIGVGLGIATYRTENPRQAVLAVTSTFLTIPSFALFGVLIGPMGLGRPPTVTALVIYALLPIVRNTVTGLRGVDPAIVESAKGMGLNARQQLLRIELPLAWPVILTGMRVSAQISMGIAAIGAVVNAPGLGIPILRGLARYGGFGALEMVVAGTLGVIVLALLIDAAFQGIDRLTTPKGIR